MQSRQIQIFGLLATSLLILFIVIFLGKDFYRLYQSYTQSSELPALDDDQIVMQSYAVENLKQMLDMEQGTKAEKAVEKVSKTDTSLSQSQREEAAAGDVAHVAKTDAVSPQRAAAVSQSAPVKRPVAEAQQIDTTERETATVAANRPADTQKSAPVVIAEPETLAKRNRRIHRMLQNAHLFANGTKLAASDRKVLESVVADLGSLEAPYRLEIEGHTRAGVPERVSLQMARATADYLRERLPGVRIGTVGYGNRYPISDDPYDKENRRVEIIVRRSAE